MRFATLKSEEQLDMQTLHRVRDRLVGDPRRGRNCRGAPPPRGERRDRLRQGSGADSGRRRLAPRSQGSSGHQDGARRLSPLPGPQGRDPGAAAEVDSSQLHGGANTTAPLARMRVY